MTIKLDTARRTYTAAARLTQVLEFFRTGCPIKVLDPAGNQYWLNPAHVIGFTVEDGS